MSSAHNLAVAKWAEIYANTMGWVPLATHIVLDYTPEGYPICSCSKGVSCSSAGKHPILKYKDIQTPEQGLQQLYEVLQSVPHDVNLAIRTWPLGPLVVDLDDGEGYSGRMNFEGWRQKHNLQSVNNPLSQTLVANSGGGGRHIFLSVDTQAHPNALDLKPSNSSEQFGRGVDIKAGGQPVHVFPSRHKSGKQYEWQQWARPILPAPSLLIKECLRRPASPVLNLRRDPSDNYTPTQQEILVFGEKLARSTKGNRKKIGNNIKAAFDTTPNGMGVHTLVAEDGDGHDAFRDMAYHICREWPGADPDLLASYFAPAVDLRLRMLPGSNTTYEDVAHAFRTAAEKSKEHAQSWQSRLTLNQDGTPKSTPGNVLLCLLNHEALKDVFGINRRTGRLTYLKPPPYPLAASDTQKPNTFPRDVRIEEETHDLSLWLAENVRICGATEPNLRGAMLSAAKWNAYDPLYDWLKAQEWDGVPRLHYIFQQAGIEDTPWSRIIMPRWFLSLTARIMMPGCKVDTMLIAEGQQGVGKSSFFEAILPDPDYFSDTLNHPKKDTETVRLIHSGPAVFELGELAGFGKTDAEDIKGFLSARQDNIRPLYGQYRSEPRRCIFVGSTNHIEYLRDSTGNRRFWPVRVPRKMNLNLIRELRAQLFAEARVRIENGEQWWLTESEEILARLEQDDREESDALHEIVLEYLNKTPPENHTEQMAETGLFPGNIVTVTQIAIHALKMDKDKIHKGYTRQITAILRKEGWLRVRLNDAARTRAWQRPGSTLLQHQTAQPAWGGLIDRAQQAAAAAAAAIGLSFGAPAAAATPPPVPPAAYVQQYVPSPNEVPLYTQSTHPASQPDDGFQGWYEPGAETLLAKLSAEDRALIDEHLRYVCERCQDDPRTREGFEMLPRDMRPGGLDWVATCIEYIDTRRWEKDEQIGAWDPARRQRK